MSNPDLKTPTLTERQEFENNINSADIQNENFYVLPKKSIVQITWKQKAKAKNGKKVKIVNICARQFWKVTLWFNIGT